MCIARLIEIKVYQSCISEYRHKTCVCVCTHTKYIMIITKALKALDIWTFNSLMTSVRFLYIVAVPVMILINLTQHMHIWPSLFYIRKSRADPEIYHKGVQGIFFAEGGGAVRPSNLIHTPSNSRCTHVIVCNSNCDKLMLTFHGFSLQSLLFKHMFQHTISVKQN